MEEHLFTPPYTPCWQWRGDHKHRKRVFKRSGRSSLEKLHEIDTPKTWIPSSVRNYIVGGMPVLLEDVPGTDVTGLLCINVTFFLQEGTLLRDDIQWFPCLVGWNNSTPSIACSSHSKSPGDDFLHGLVPRKSKGSCCQPMRPWSEMSGAEQSALCI